jgi:hypothetical protein
VLSSDGCTRCRQHDSNRSVTEALMQGFRYLADFFAPAGGGSAPSGQFVPIKQQPGFQPSK